jgi:hypothetical protein
MRLTRMSGTRYGGKGTLPVLAIAIAIALGFAVHLVLAAVSPKQTAATKSVCSQQFGSFGVGHWPPACWRPYGLDSPFNVPIPSHPRLAPESTAITDYMQSHHWLFEGDHHGRFTIDNGGSRPVYWSKSSDPLVKVICGGDHSCQRGMKVHIPKGAQPENASDGLMAVVDQARGLEYDFWQASTPKNGAMRVAAGNSIPIGPRTGTGLGGDASAAYLGVLGGLIRAPELAAGRIEHALALTVECVQSRDVWPSPARGRGDLTCANNGVGPHFGNLLQLNMSDSEIAGTRAPAWQRAIMMAMAHYGMYVVNTNGRGNSAMSLTNEADQSFTSFGYAGEMTTFVRAVGGSTEVVGVPIDMSKFRVIAPCVPRKTC